MSHQRDSEIQAVIDRIAIYDCMVRYCRGVDRLDPELIRSAYHPDGIDDHGGFVGPREPFIEWGQNICRTLWTACQHHISNHSCEIQGDIAHTETYFIHIAMLKAGGRELRAGRYIQKLERRGGKWGITESICTIDCDDPTLEDGSADMGVGAGIFVQGMRDRSDPSYARPLQVDRKRITHKTAAE